MAFVDAPHREAQKADPSSMGGAVTVHHQRRFENHFSTTTEGSAMNNNDEGIFRQEQWKPAGTAGNDVVSQRDIGGVAAVRMHVLDAYVIERATFTGCLNECLRHDGREDQDIAKAIHISKGYFSKLLRAVWAAQMKRLIRFCRETRCAAPLQKMADELGFELREKKSALERERDEAVARAAELEARIAAERRIA